MLVAVAGATIVSAVLDLAADGVATVGTLPQGFPKPSLPWTSFDDVGPLLLAAIGIVLVSLTDTIATASSFAARRGDELQPNQEMIGIGAANIAAGFFQGFAVSTSGSRTAVAEQSGAKTQLTGVVGAGLVAVLLLFLNSLLADLPQSALAGVVIAAALSLTNLGALRQYATVRTSSLLLSLVATLGVVLLGVLEGIVVAIFLAVLLFFRRNWWPHGAVLGRTDDSEGWHSVDDLPDAREEPGIVVYRWEAPLFFANARHVPPADPPPGHGAAAPLGRAAVRGHHRHRRHRGRGARAARRRAQRAPASTWRSWRCAAASRTSSAATACTTPSTATTSTPPSTPRSPPSPRSPERARRRPLVQQGFRPSVVPSRVRPRLQRPPQASPPRGSRRSSRGFVATSVDPLRPGQSLDPTARSARAAHDHERTDFDHQRGERRGEDLLAAQITLAVVRRARDAGLVEVEAPVAHDPAVAERQVRRCRVSEMRAAATALARSRCRSSRRPRR